MPSRHSSRTNREQQHVLRQLDAAQRRLKRAKNDVEVLLRKARQTGLSLEEIGPSAQQVLQLEGNVLHVYGGHPKLDELHSHGVIKLDPELADALHYVLSRTHQPLLTYRRRWGDPHGAQNVCTPTYTVSAAD